MKRLTRRQACGLLLSAPLALRGGDALGLGAKSRVQLGQLLHVGGNPQPRPTGLKRLAWELDKRTSVDVSLEPRTLRVTDAALFRTPFIVLGGDRAFPAFTGAEVNRLRQYLVHGGFLLIDSADARPGGGFDKSVRALVKSLFPKRGLAPLPSTHTLHKSFYLLDRAVGRVASVSHLEGVTRDKRTLLVYSQNDLAGAWARDSFGQWEFGVYPGGDRQRELAIRWGINVVMYALCVDYKADQVHIPFILKRRRWKVAP